MNDAHYRLGPILNAINPDLSAFKGLGGKLILWHGWPDQNIAPRNSIAYYRTVADAKWGRAKMETQDSARLFVVPGMQHCSRGAGPNTFDTLAALALWVEQGIAPDQIIASHSTSGVVDFTRPLCVYPSVARWTGKGDWKDAANWRCKAMGLGVSAEQNDPANLIYGMKR